MLLLSRRVTAIWLLSRRVTAIWLTNGAGNFLCPGSRPRKRCLETSETLWDLMFSCVESAAGHYCRVVEGRTPSDVACSHGVSKAG